jgi:hypothetical protein
MLCGRDRPGGLGRVGGTERSHLHGMRENEILYFGTGMQITLAH